MNNILPHPTWETVQAIAAIVCFSLIGVLLAL
jgi:hypothetical protein